MADIGLSAHVQADVSSYQTQMRILGIHLPMRVAKALGIAIGLAVIIGIYFVFALGLEPDTVSFLFPVIGLIAFVYGFWQHKGLAPEVYLPEKAINKFQGKRLVRHTAENGLRTIRDAEVKRDKEYRKQARKKRGTRCAEIYIPRIEAAQARGQEEDSGAEAAR